MVIQWSEEDELFLVHLHEFPWQEFHTHGRTYEEAVKSGLKIGEIEEYVKQFPLKLPEDFFDLYQMSDGFNHSNPATLIFGFWFEIDEYLCWVRCRGTQPTFCTGGTPVPRLCHNPSKSIFLYGL